MKRVSEQRRVLAIAAALLVLAGLGITVALGALPSGDGPDTPKIDSARPAGASPARPSGDASPTTSTPDSTSTAPRYRDRQPSTRPQEQDTTRSRSNSERSGSDRDASDDDRDADEPTEQRESPEAEDRHETVTPEVRDDDKDSESRAPRGEREFSGEADHARPAKI